MLQTGLPVQEACFSQGQVFRLALNHNLRSLCPAKAEADVTFVCPFTSQEFSQVSPKALVLQLLL